MIAGVQSGWVVVFARDGKPLWALPMPHEVRALAAFGAGVLVACADNAVYAVTGDGRLSGRHALGGTPLGALSRAGDCLLTGDASGRVTAFRAEARTAR